MNEHREENIMDQVPTKDNHESGYLRPIDTANLLKKLLWQEFELSRMVFGWVPAVPDFQMKGDLCRFGYIHNKHAQILSERIKELPGALSEKEGSPASTRSIYERISLAPSPAAFFSGYREALHQLYIRYERVMEQLDALLDAPTADTLEIILIDRSKQLSWLNRQLQFAHSEDATQRKSVVGWTQYTSSVIEMLDSAADPEALEEWPAHPRVKAAGPVPVKSVWDDEKFPRWIPPKQPIKSYDDPTMSPLSDSIKQMHYINATEMSAAESLCYMYYGVQGMPLQFYFDLARHTWDESRHALMGVRRLEQMGYKTDQFKYFRGEPGLELQDVAKEWFPDMYAGLTMVAEPCSFIKKRKSAEKFWEFGDALSAIHCEFDMADERLHVDYGKKWGPELYKQINDIITAAEMSERARIRRLEQLGEAASPEEARRIAKSFPGFCGLSTVELKYSNY